MRKRSSDTANNIPWNLIVVFLLLSVGIIISGFIYYRYEKNRLIADNNQDISALAELKVKQISDWRRARVSAASYLCDNDYFVDDVARYFNQQSVASESKLIRWLKPMKNGYNLSTILLFDNRGTIRFNYGDDAPRIGAIGKKHIKNSLQKKQTILSDFHFAADSSDIHLDIISSFDRSVNRYNNMIGGILFRIDPSIDLYPLIQTWPKPSETAEMLLIRQEGNSVQYLNELRHAKKMALKLRLPLNSENSLAVLALRGTTGIVEGKDYRGVDVRAAIFKIPDTPWFLISKIDKNEIEHPLRERMLSLVIIVTLLVLIAGTVIFFIGYRQRAHFIRNQFQMELDRKAILAHFDYLVKYSSDIYLLLDEKLFIVEANERALSTYGYTREEIQNLSISDLLSQFEKDFESKKLTLVKDEDSAVFELLQKRKDGITIPVEMSIRLLTIENIKYYQCIARNISERKSAERALRDSEERYRKIFMDNPNPMWVYDIETLRFLEVNSKAINHYGYTRDEFLSMTIADIRPDEDVSRLLENVSSLTDGFDDAGVWRHRKKDGTIIYVEITSHIINHGGRKAEIILSHDVTERILMEEMVKSAQQHLRELATIINSSPIVAFLWSASPGWPVIFVSENVTQLGYTVEEFISGKISYEQIIHPDDLERIIEETLKYAQEGIDEFNQLYRIVTSSGTVRYVDDRTVVRRNTNGTPTHFQGILVDITARVEAEEWVEQVLDNTPEAVFFVDVLPDEVFRFNRLNRAEETAIGVRNVEVQGKTPDECLPPEIAERVTKKYQQCFHEGKSISYEEELELPSGKKVWNTVLVPIRNLDGRIYRIVGFSRDITERKLYEVVLQRQSVAMNAAIDGMAILDENESYIYVNDAHARVYGYESGEELVGKKWHILYDDAERHRFQKEIMPLMVQQGHWHGEACGRKKNGSSFPQEVSLTQIESGGLICVVRDIS
ncbi:MAG: hypothetical protein C0417_06605 [Chlorobiaceae bacterium]|nr:hypothetical protein [Chlorobiaceae bacterium]